MRHVARLEALAERPSLHRLREDDGGRPAVLGGHLERGVDLPVVVPPTTQPAQIVIREVLDERAESGVRAEEVLADVVPRLDGVLLILAVQRVHHLLLEQTVVVAGQQVVPLAGPDDLDHVPPGAAEHALQLLDDLAVAANRTVEPLEVAVHHERQVVELLTGRDAERAERFGLVALTVAQEAPNAAAARVDDSPRAQVAVEPGLVDRVDRAQAHGDRGILPEVGHEPRVRIRGESLSGNDLATEVIELLLAEAPLEERARVEAGGRVSLVEHLVPGTIVLAPEEVVEADLVEAGGRSVGRDVAAEPREAVIRARDHRHGVPPDQPADLQLQALVTGKLRLVVRRDRVDVRASGQSRELDVAALGVVEKLAEKKEGPFVARALENGIQGLHPLRGLLGIGVRDLIVGFRKHGLSRVW